MPAPRVSVIIACYKGEAVIETALQSALAQTMPDLEIIVVDDGSPDAAAAVVERYTQNGRVRLIRHGQNRGISAARNTAIKAARGAYLGFLDQDDYWYPDRLETALTVFDADTKGAVGLVFGNEETRLLGSGKLVPGRVAAPRGVNALSRTEFLCTLLQSNFIPTAAALFRRDCFDTLGLLDEQITSGIDDFEMFLRIARHYDIRHVDHVQAIRHVHKGNYTKLSRMMPDALRMLDRLAAEEPAVARIAARARSHYLYLLSREKQQSGDYRAAARIMGRAIRWRPGDVKCWLALGQSLLGPIGTRLPRGRAERSAGP